MKKTQGVGGGGQIDPLSVFRVKEDRYLNKVIHQITRYGVLASLKDVLRISELTFGLTQKVTLSQRFPVITNLKKIVCSAKLH